MRKVLVRVDLCVGCRTCEMVCSQHHIGAFGRTASSIYVDRNERKGDIEITVFEEETDGHIGCDLCSGLRVPLCVKFCPTGAIAIR